MISRVRSPSWTKSNQKNKRMYKFKILIINVLFHIINHVLMIKLIYWHKVSSTINKNMN